MGFWVVSQKGGTVIHAPGGGTAPTTGAPEQDKLHRGLLDWCTSALQRWQPIDLHHSDHTFSPRWELWVNATCTPRRSDRASGRQRVDKVPVVRVTPVSVSTIVQPVWLRIDRGVSTCISFERKSTHDCQETHPRCSCGDCHMRCVLPSAAAATTSGDSVANARDATASFQDPAAALAAGYDLLTDAADLACIDEPGSGTMGMHYVKGALVPSGTIDATRPQALVYQRLADGRLHLGAVEYVAFQAEWDAAHTSPPALFGEQFMLTPTDNRFGLPAYYSLHAWIWLDNPAGMFSMWNPGATCTPA